MNNRELATLILLGLGVLGGVVLTRGRGLRRPLLLFLSPTISVPFVLYCAWIVGAVVVAHDLGFWTWDLTGGTVLWLAFSGLAWFFNIHEADQRPGYFQGRIRSMIGAAALTEFFVNLEVFSLPVELLLLTVAVVLGAMAAIAERPGYECARRRIAGLLGLLGLVLAAWTAVHLTNDSSLTLASLARQLILPLWLSAIAVPYLYFLGLFMAYESLYRHMLVWNDYRRPHWSALVGTVLELRGRLTDVGGYRGPACEAGAKATSIGQSRAAVRDYKVERRVEQRERRLARERLSRFAGAVGRGLDGRTLDRREFKATKEALGWLATCQMGWFRNGDRPAVYRHDLLTVIGDFLRQGLPENHGIEMRVRRDGQAWYAYRRTPSGLVFGIGASGPPPSQWYFDGLRPPTGFPAKKHGWTSALEETRCEWMPEPAT